MLEAIVLCCVHDTVGKTAHKELHKSKIKKKNI